MTTAASARATRSVSSLSPTSTMAARPRSSRWLSSHFTLRSGTSTVRWPPLAAAVVGLARHGGLDRRAQDGRVVQQRADVGLAPGEQAGAQPAVGGEAQAVARLAEVLRDAGDEADGPARAGDLPVLRRTVAVGAVVADEDVLLHEPAQHVAGRQQPSLSPEVFAGDPPVQRHELDEAHVHVVLAREVDERAELLLHAGQEERVDLDRREAGRERRVEAGQRVPEAAAARDAREALRVEAVEAHVDALEPRRGELVREPGQQQAVGGQRDVVDAAGAAEHADEVGAAGPDQRLTAGDAHLGDADVGGDAREDGELLVAQDLAVAARLDSLRRHAVRAAQVAPVGDGEAQVVDPALFALGAVHGTPSVPPGRVRHTGRRRIPRPDRVSLQAARARPAAAP